LGYVLGIRKFDKPYGHCTGNCFYFEQFYTLTAGYVDRLRETRNTYIL
jgi:hypothetical protein